MINYTDFTEHVIAIVVYNVDPANFVSNIPDCVVYEYCFKSSKHIFKYYVLELHTKSHFTSRFFHVNAYPTALQVKSKT